MFNNKINPDIKTQLEKRKLKKEIQIINMSDLKKSNSSMYKVIVCVKLFLYQ